MSDAQELFLDFLKKNLPSGKSLAETLEETLHTSRDGAYRRIAGRTALTFREAIVLVQELHLDMGEWMEKLPGRYIFELHSLVKEGQKPGEGLKDLNVLLERIQPNEAILATKQVPGYHLQDFPDLAFFYLFFALKTTYGEKPFRDQAFSLNYPDKNAILQRTEGVRILAQGFPSTTEIWWNETINSLLKPVLYYWETGTIRNREEALYLLDKVEAMLSHLQLMTAAGKRFSPGEKPSPAHPDFYLFCIDVAPPDTTALLKGNTGTLAAIVLNMGDILTTSHQGYCRRTERLLLNLKEKSSNITIDNERQRLQFFLNNQKMVEKVRKRIGQ